MEKDGVIKTSKNPYIVKDIVTSTKDLNLQGVGNEHFLTDNKQIKAFLKLKDGYTSDDLTNQGISVLAIRGDIAIVMFDEEKAEEISGLDCVKKLSIERKVSSHIDLSRASVGVDEMHEGKNLNMPYTGKGVLTGVVDQGIDPNHISFLDAEGNPRIKYLMYFDGTMDRDGYPYIQYYGDNITYFDDKGNVMRYPSVDKFSTDNKNTYHGTHTLNILGGGYEGNITVNKNGSIQEVPNPYYGVAKDADLMASCGDLSDACVALGLNGLLDYADYRKAEDGTPAVVSVSLGSTAGPHDPNNLMNQFLSLCGQDYIIVVSSGNEGDLKIALNKTLTEEDNSLKTMIYPYGFRYDPTQGEGSTNNTYIRNGVVMIYSEDATPFTITGFIMTGEPGNYRKRATFNIGGQDGSYFLSDPYYANYVGGSVNSTVARYFDGYIGGGSMLDEELGRFYGAFDYFLYTNPETGFTADGEEAVIVGFEITGENGQRIDCFCDGANTWLYNYGMETYDDGSRDGTISDMAVGENILVVGAYNTRENWTALDGVSYSYGDVEGFSVGDIGPYSSFGTMADGRTLPHVCAPGTAVMSAVSTPWIDSYFKGYESYIPKNTTAKATLNGKNYYWKPETGTSMSTPLVAGSIALWLEADPNLTIDDVFEIIEKTSKKDEFVINGNKAQWGAGKFDALAGLKEVINNASVESLTESLHNDRLILTELNPGIYSLFVGNAAQLKIDVFSMAGNCVFTRDIKGNETTLDLSSLAKGIYVVKANNHIAKIYIY